MQGDATLSMRRNLFHYHFTSWPDFGVPKSPSGMLKFMRKIKHGSPTGYGAVVVHCRWIGFELFRGWPTRVVAMKWDEAKGPDSSFKFSSVRC